MIVTCPGCASKYRVRNEAVPPDGARMRCPKCETLFLAKPPAAGDSTDDALPSGAFASAAFAPPPPTGTAHLLPPQPGNAPGFASPQPPSFAAPFAQPPGPFSAGSSSTAVPQFGGAPSMPPHFTAASPGTFGNPGAGSGFVPQAPTTAGPLTAMMRQIDASSLPPGSLPPPSMPMPMATSMPPMSLSSSQPLPTLPPQFSPAPDDDPFARINVDQRQDPGFAAPTLERLRPEPRAPTRPGTTMPPVPTTQVPVRPRQEAPASMAMIVGSWIAVVVGGFGAVMGVVFAAWTSEAVNFDASLMPFAERSLGAEPPFSFIGRDDVEPSELRHQAEAKEAAGDLPAAAVLWRRVLDRDPADIAARAGLPRVLTALGDRLR